MVMSPKSRCCKSRCCKVKGLPRGGLFDIGLYTFFRPRKVTIYVLRTTRLLADYDTVYLHLKKTNTTNNRKMDSRRSQNFLKTDSLTCFSKKWCQHMPPSFGVNNLLLRNFIKSVISLDSKLAEESQQILGAINTTTSTLIFSPNLVVSIVQALRR
jgi:hypothetical protein